MYIEMTPWAVAILIECILLGIAASVFFYLGTEKAKGEMKARLKEAAQGVRDAKAEAKRVQEEAMKKRTIVTFDSEDIQGLAEAGELPSDPEAFERIKTKITESADVLSDITNSASELNTKLTEVMDKQMEAVNMVGRLGGTGGLPPELKEKAEAILDVFRSMDDLLGAAYEETDKIETGVGEVTAVIVDFKETDPVLKSPSAEALNNTLKRKAGIEVEAATDADTAGSEPPMDAFDSESARQEEAAPAA